jgi:hypothetical protein
VYATGKAMSRRSVANGSGDGSSGVSADGVRRVGVSFAMDNGLQWHRIRLSWPIESLTTFSLKLGMVAVIDVQGWAPAFSAAATFSCGGAPSTRRWLAFFEWISSSSPSKYCEQHMTHVTVSDMYSILVFGWIGYTARRDDSSLDMSPLAREGKETCYGAVNRAVNPGAWQIAVTSDSNSG